MDPVTVFGWVIGLLGVGMVGIGVALVLSQEAITTAFALTVLGLFVLIAGMAVVSVAKGEQGLGVIY